MAQKTRKIENFFSYYYKNQKCKQKLIVKLMTM